MYYNILSSWLISGRYLGIIEDVVQSACSRDHLQRLKPNCRPAYDDSLHYLTDVPVFHRVAD